MADYLFFEVALTNYHFFHSLLCEWYWRKSLVKTLKYFKHSILLPHLILFIMLLYIVMCKPVKNNHRIKIYITFFPAIMNGGLPHAWLKRTSVSLIPEKPAEWHHLRSSGDCCHSNQQYSQCYRSFVAQWETQVYFNSVFWQERTKTKTIGQRFWKIWQLNRANSNLSFTWSLPVT